MAGRERTELVLTESKMAVMPKAVKALRNLGVGPGASDGGTKQRGDESGGEASDRNKQGGARGF